MTEQYTGASGPRMQGQHVVTTKTTNHNPLPTFLWSSSMKFSSILRGLVLTAALLILGTEAYAQLPVRTRTLQLIGSTSGVLSQSTPATTSSYTVVWPSADFGYGGPGTETAVMMGDMTAAGTVNLRWREIDNDLIDGLGASGEIAWFLDANTIRSNPTVTYEANTVILGDTNASGGILRMIATGSTANYSNFTTTVNQNTNWVFPDYGAATDVNVVATGNAAVANYILRVDATGVPQWVVDPFYNAERGLANPDDNVYSYTITGLVGTPDATDMIMVTSVDISGTPTGNILTVSAVGANQFTVSASGPFTGTERISWLFIPITP